MINVQEALKAAIVAMELYIEGELCVAEGEDLLNKCKAALSEIESEASSQPVGFVIDTPNIYGAKLQQGLKHNTALYTSPQPREWVELPKNVAEYIYTNTLSAEECAKEFSEALKQLNTKG